MLMTRLTLLLALIATPLIAGAWETHTVRLLNGAKSDIAVPAKLQIVSEPWNRVVAVPYIVYMPEKKRVLMLVSCDYPHHPETLFSDDDGTTWSAPRAVISAKDDTPVPGLATALTYQGDGRVIFLAGTTRWVSSDFGVTWNPLSEIAKTVDDHPWYSWDPIWVDRAQISGDLLGLIETGYTVITPDDGTKHYSQGYIRFSDDQGATWSESTRIPQWKGVNEVALIRIADGTLMGAYRTDIPKQKEGEWIDHYEGLGLTFSKDKGKTWIKNEPLYDYGRHHPSTILLPSGRLVMTYVVRKGYTDTAEGFPQFGIEAIVSDDNGQSWDLDHRYILHSWHGDRTDENKWWTSSQATSTVLLPDGDFLTAFGTGYRSKETETPNKPGPRDAGLIRWRLSDAPLDGTSTITDAPFESVLRNEFDPAPK
tara:strand:- start:135 stop:1406 length:1272 start_codon:yes stop_codon:yes gene_type:complete